VQIHGIAVSVVGPVAIFLDIAVLILKFAFTSVFSDEFVFVDPLLQRVLVVRSEKLYLGFGAFVDEYAHSLPADVEHHGAVDEERFVHHFGVEVVAEETDVADDFLGLLVVLAQGEALHIDDGDVLAQVGLVLFSQTRLYPVGAAFVLPNVVAHHKV